MKSFEDELRPAVEMLNNESEKNDIRHSIASNYMVLYLAGVTGGGVFPSSTLIGQVI